MLADDPRSLSDSEHFILDLGRALHAAGATAQWLEARLPAIGATRGVEVRVFSSPTMLIIGFGPLATQKQRVLRITPMPLDVARFAAVDDVAGRVEAGTMEATEGIEALRTALAAPPRFGTFTTIGAFGLASACVGRFFSADLADILVACVLGLCVGAACEIGSRRRRIALTVAPLSAALVGFCAIGIDRAVFPISELAVTIAALIVLVPGYGVTSAIDELATRNLVSGASRLAEALFMLVTLGFGMALGRTAGAIVPVTAPDLASPMLPGWTEAIAMIGAAAGLGIFVRARGRDFVPIVLIGAMTFSAARVGAGVLGVELGAFAGAFVAGLASNAFGRWRDQPALITAIPALILLVPGSIGFRGVASLLQRDVVPGVEAGFTAAMIAVSIVVGGLLASAALPERRIRARRDLD